MGKEGKSKELEIGMFGNEEFRWEIGTTGKWGKFWKSIKMKNKKFGRMGGLWGCKLENEILKEGKTAQK